MEKIIIEIRAAEGGLDSKMLVEDLRNIYVKTARNHGLKYDIIEDRNGFASI
jgi:protein subunit release factor A